LYLIWRAFIAAPAHRRNGGELTTEEGCGLLSEVKPFGNALVVLTGWDPRKRPDLCELIRHSLVTGLRTHVTAPRPVERAACGISRMPSGWMAQMQRTTVFATLGKRPGPDHGHAAKPIQAWPPIAIRG
jgi:hypothetical protein